MLASFDSFAEARIALARSALAATPDSADLTFALADALADAGRFDEYAQTYRRAYRLRPQYFAQGGTERDFPRHLLQKARALIERGVIYSPIIAALAKASATLGDSETVRRLLDYDRFFRVIPQVMPQVMPQEFSDTGFYETLAAEIRSGLTFYDAPTDRAIRNAWRHDTVMRSQAPASRAITQEFHRQVERYIAGLPDDPSHPFLASRPREFALRGWAVVSSAAGYHKSHIHPEAWASGVYYVVRPEVSRLAGSHRGWLRVGPPPLQQRASAPGWQERLVEPEPGTLVLMPGYFYHDTAPTGVDEDRICIAFDVTPMELVDAHAD